MSMYIHYRRADKARHPPSEPDYLRWLVLALQWRMALRLSALRPAFTPPVGNGGVMSMYIHYRRADKVRHPPPEQDYLRWLVLALQWRMALRLSASRLLPLWVTGV